ncbi:hypothetical protein [Clostridium transplantifaecale]|uniref:hypothetical protein n=1 Tax=Clostridium transplantifaecale TaxID=2479838 RepID=UPI0013DD9696|nr:hypothetical protein [Clostridium transplantifaecale]
MKKKWRKGMAFMLSAALVSGSIWPGMGITAGAAVQSRMIEEFEELPEETLFQAVPLGTKKRELKLPNYLNAKLEAEESSGGDGGDGEDGGGAATPSPAAATGSEADKTAGWRRVKVTWVLDEDFSEQETYDGQVPGIYVFEAELTSDRYELSGAELPVIEVEVLEEAGEEGQEATPSDAPEEILVTDWTYLDDGNLSDDGSLTLYESAYGFDEVVSLLPGRIQAVVEEDGTTKTLLLTWDSPDYRERQERREEAEEQEESGAQIETGAQAESEDQTDGSYRFRWELPEGYVLSEEAKEPELTVIRNTGELSLEEQAERMERQMTRQSDSNRSLFAMDRTNRANQANRTNRADSFRFTVGSEAVLRELEEKVASGETWADGLFTYAESSYVLTGDIRLTEDWTPIGTEEKPFTGTFDGGGYVIYDMTIDDPALESCGLFGYVKSGTVENLGVRDADILGNKNLGNAGVVAGVLYGGTVNRCYSTGNVEANAAGGMVGKAEEGSSVTNSYSTGKVSAVVAGGIAGRFLNSVMEHCYSTGNITVLTSATGYDTSRGGGLIGLLMVEKEKSLTFTDSAAFNPSVNRKAALGGSTETDGRVYENVMFLNGADMSSFTVQNLYAFSGMKRGDGSFGAVGADTRNGADIRYDAANGTFSPSLETLFDDSDVWDIADGKLPTLKDIGGQDGEIPDWLLDENAADLYIGSAEDLAAFRDWVNGVDRSPYDSKGKTVRLTADITLSGRTDWTPIGEYATPFSGTFDGGGHFIRNLKINDRSRDYLGLFGWVDKGTIRNLGLENVQISGKNYIGGIAAYLDKGSSVLNCYSIGNVTGNAYVGGLVGNVQGKSLDEEDSRKSIINNCWYAGNVEAGVEKAGGIAGRISAGCEIEHNYSTGTTAAEVQSGGLIGTVADYITVDSYTGLVRYNAALMRTVDGQSEIGRIYGWLASASAGSGWKENYAWSGMTVGGAVIPGNDGTGKDGKSGAAGDIVMNRELFPYSDWILREGYYPIQKQFGEGAQFPLDAWLSGQADSAFEMALSPAAYRFPDAEAGYGAQTAAAFTVKNTGKVKIDGLAVSLINPWTDGGTGAAGTAEPYFVLSGAGLPADIAYGETAAFTVTPAAGLPEGNYRVTVLVTGNHGLKAEAEVEFTVKPKTEPAPDPSPTPQPQPKPKRDSDRGITAVKPPVYTYLDGNVPSSQGDGVWEKQPGGIWKFYKTGNGGGRYAVKEWLYIDGFWYLFDDGGRMIVGWACVNGVWYYLSTAEYAAANAGTSGEGTYTADANAGTAGTSAASGLKEGAMVTGWFHDPFTGQWFWLDESGAMAAGWREIDGIRYYFNLESDGSRGALKEEET